MNITSKEVDYMAESKMEFKYFKSEDEFVKRLEFIRHYFGPEATNILNKNFVFNKSSDIFRK